MSGMMLKDFIVALKQTKAASPGHQPIMDDNLKFFMALYIDV